MAFDFIASSQMGQGGDQAKMGIKIVRIISQHQDISIFRSCPLALLAEQSAQRIVSFLDRRLRRNGVTVMHDRLGDAAFVFQPDTGDIFSARVLPGHFNRVLAKQG